MANFVWPNLPHGIEERQFKCSNCGNQVGSHSGFATNNKLFAIYICPFCKYPTFFGPHQIPGPKRGEEVAGLPPDVAAIYEEIRSSMSVGAHTLAALGCRKILMHIAVEKNAKPGDTFVTYVNHLDSLHYIPPDGKGWVDFIRLKANEANHEIVVIHEETAIAMIDLTTMLMKFVYDFPKRIPKAPTT